MVAGQPFGIGRPHHLRGLAAEGSRKLLHADLGVGGNDDANRLAVDIRHQRLEHAMRRDAHGFGGLHADARGLGIVVVSMQRKRNAEPAEFERRPRFLRHRVCPLTGEPLPDRWSFRVARPFSPVETRHALPHGRPPCCGYRGIA